MIPSYAKTATGFLTGNGTSTAISSSTDPITILYIGLAKTAATGDVKIIDEQNNMLSRVDELGHTDFFMNIKTTSTIFVNRTSLGAANGVFYTITYTKESESPKSGTSSPALYGFTYGEATNSFFLFAIFLLIAQAFLWFRIRGIRVKS